MPMRPLPPTLSPGKGEGGKLATATDHLSVVFVGHVDHGKSTLLGRLLADTGALPDGKIEKVQAICRQQGKEFEYAFLMDAFLEEQEQGITIDTARTFFSWEGREYTIIDAPGHKEFLKNMVSGAARAQAALLVIDASEGVQEQSRKHGYLLSLIGIRQIAVVLNKMDVVGYDEGTYREIEAEYRSFLAQLRLSPHTFIPASAKFGDNVVGGSSRMPWHSGPSVLEALGRFGTQAAPDEAPLRLSVQDVYKFDARRIIAGRIASGRLAVGDRLLFSPSSKSATVRSIEGFNVESPRAEAGAGRSVGITLDEQLFIERGEVASHEAAAPAVSTAFRCHLFWMGNQPLRAGGRYRLRIATRDLSCEVVTIHRIVDTDDLNAHQERSTVGRNEVAELTIRTRAPIAFDLFGQFETTGRFVLVDGHDVSGGGIITAAVADELAGVRAEGHRRDLAWILGGVSPEERAERFGHQAALVLLVGPPATAEDLARQLEQRLVAEGQNGYFLIAGNLRRAPDAPGRRDADLTRRFAEAVRLLIATGAIVISTDSALGGANIDLVRALVPAATIIVAQLGDAPAREEADLVAPAGDPNAAVKQVIETLRLRGVLGEAESRPHFLPPNYAI